MNLVVLCKGCRKDITVKSCASDRGELAKEKGKIFSVVCKHCQQVHSYEVNQVRAVASRMLDLILLFTTLIFSIFLGIYLFRNYWGTSIYMAYAIPLVLAMPSALYFVNKSSQNRKLRIFNGWRV